MKTSQLLNYVSDFLKVGWDDGLVDELRIRADRLDQLEASGNPIAAAANSAGKEDPS
jgi:hypothetical protein